MARTGTSAGARTTARKSNKIYCYMGPNIKGYLHTSQVFRGERENLLKEYAQLVEAHPLVKNLLVPGESLAVARLKVKEPGTAHYANYHKLSQELIEEAQGKVRPEYEAHQRGAMDMPAGPMYARRWENKSTWVGAVVRLT